MLATTCQLLFLGTPLLLAAVAQGVCIKYDWFKILKRPLDMGRTYRGRRIFGDHKTWRGVLINVFGCSLGALIQGRLLAQVSFPPWLPLLDYDRHALLAGILLGAGMSFGELPNSFLKRQMEIPPGAQRKGVPGGAFFIFDQVDLVIGIWLFLFLLVRPSLSLVLCSFLLALPLHVCVSTAGYLLKMRKTLV
jgi:hypothetical protein